MQLPVSLGIRCPVFLQLLRLGFIRFLLRLGLIFRSLAPLLLLFFRILRGFPLILGHTHLLPARRRNRHADQRRCQHQGRNP